jgi:hypothetical protein
MLLTPYAMALALIVGASEAAQEEKAARRFEHSLTEDEHRAAQAEKNYERGQAEVNQESAHLATVEAEVGRQAALTRHELPSPKWGLELRFGPYRPALADSAPVNALYELVFVSKDRSLFHGRPMQMGIEVDAYPFRRLGLVGFYGRVAYWRATGKTRLCVDPAGTPVNCDTTTVFTSQLGGDQAELSSVPLSAGAVWRVDLLRRLTNVPIQFNAKLGLDYHIWWAEAGDTLSTYRGEKARGGTLGFSLSVGAALGLELFSRATLANRNSGIRNAVFVEYQLVRGGALVGKHRGHRLDFTDNRMVIVGLSVDFQ